MAVAIALQKFNQGHALFCSTLPQPKGFSTPTDPHIGQVQNYFKVFFYAAGARFSKNATVGKIPYK